VTRRGITLIEMLVALAITSILAGVIVFAFSIVFDTYHFIQDDILLQRSLDEILQKASDGDFLWYGIKDSLEIVSADRHAISFVPLWVDDAHRAEPLTVAPQTFLLNRPIKAGASLPICEVLMSHDPAPLWRQYPIIFSYGGTQNNERIVDMIIADGPIPPGHRVRFLFQPDHEESPDTIMTIEQRGSEIIRTYKKRSETLPRYLLNGVRLLDMEFRYFDNTNTEIPPGPRTGSIATEKIADISAVQFTVKLQRGSTQKEGSAFINLRNTRTAGKGLIIRKGIRLKIPDSRHIRTFSLVNITGVKENGRIVLEARSGNGRTWRVFVYLEARDGAPVISKYAVEYPSGSLVYSETINLTIDLPLSFLTLGGNGRYDYDIDEGVEDVVDLEGDVELRVLEMDIAGAALFIRP